MHGTSDLLHIFVSWGLFRQSPTLPCLFTRMAPALLTCFSMLMTLFSLLRRQICFSIIGRLHAEFAMTDLVDLHHFLGISVTRTSEGLFLSQRQYASDLLQRAGMSESLYLDAS